MFDLDEVLQFILQIVILVKMYVETFKTDAIVFIGNIMSSTIHGPIIFSITVSLLIFLCEIMMKNV
jgi:hypothetical protein